MVQDLTLTHRRLSELWADPTIPTLPLDGRRYVIFSDLHLGDGSGADDFAPNAGTLYHALNYYYAEGYTVVLLGDIEEFWQFEPSHVAKQYAALYARLRAFGKERLCRIYGNHDIEWRGLSDPLRGSSACTYHAPEALRLTDHADRTRFFLVHGHQGDRVSDAGIWFSRFFVRLYAPIEPYLKRLGLFRHRDAPQTPIVKNYERIFYRWAKAQNVLLICGHSHRAIFAAQAYAQQLRDEIAALESRKTAAPQVQAEVHALQETLNEEIQRGRDITPVEAPHIEPGPYYFNTGCGLYRNGITALEIADGDMRLVKWTRGKTIAQHTMKGIAIAPGIIQRLTWGREKWIAPQRKIYEEASLESLFAAMRP